MITQFIATTETAVPTGEFFWRILLTAPCIGLMLVFGLIAIVAFFAWFFPWLSGDTHGGEYAYKEVKGIINFFFPVFGRVCIVHFILTILATLFFEKTETWTGVLQFFGTILFLGLWFFAADAHSSDDDSSENSK